MGAIDLVIQIEAPSSVASGLQRIGRAGHQIDAVSEGIIIPKFRGDLLACAAVAKLMHEGRVEATRYPRNPLDVLAQQIVAMVAVEDWQDGDLFDLVRRAAPFESLSRTAFDGVLDMLSGRYPSDEFAELRPRVTWNRATGALQHAAAAPKRLAIANAGTIPTAACTACSSSAPAGTPSASASSTKRWCSRRKSARCSCSARRAGAIEEITHDRVLVTPAPGATRKDAVLEGRSRRPPARAGPGDRRADARPHRAGPADRGDRALTRDHDLEPDGGRESRRATCATRPRRRRARRRHDRHRARPRRARRLARLRAVAARRTRPRAVVHGGRRPRSGASSASTSRRCGPTTGSWCGCRTSSRRRIRSC